MIMSRYKKNLRKTDVEFIALTKKKIVGEVDALI